MAVRKQTGHRAIDLRVERDAVRRQLRATIAPPAGGAAPEQLLSALGPLLDFEALTRQRRSRLRDRRDDALPPRLPVTYRLIHRLIEPPIVLAPPVAEKVLVSAFADLHHRRPAVFDELRQE